MEQAIGETGRLTAARSELGQESSSGNAWQAWWIEGRENGRSEPERPATKTNRQTGRSGAVEEGLASSYKAELGAVGVRLQIRHPHVLQLRAGAPDFAGDPGDGGRRLVTRWSVEEIVRLLE